MIADRIRDKLKEQSDRLLDYEERGGTDPQYLEGVVQGLEWALDIAESDTGKKAKKVNKNVQCSRCGEPARWTSDKWLMCEHHGHQHWLQYGSLRCRRLTQEEIVRLENGEKEFIVF